MPDKTKTTSTLEKLFQILHLEDDAVDAELIQAALSSADILYELTRVQTSSEFSEALRKGAYDLILADYRLPNYNGMSALSFARERYPDIPFIFVSGTIGEDAAIQALTEGATDYVLKQKLSRLAPAVRRALRDAENRMRRRQAEEAQRESEEQFHAVAESANDGIISIDSRGIILYGNKAAREMFGYADKEILGQALITLMPERFREQYLNGLKRWATNRERHRVNRTEEALGLRKDGSEFPLELSIGSWQTRQGIFFTGIVRDITERKQAAENLHLQSTALEAAANGIIIADRAGKIIWANSAFTRLTGYAFEEAIGKNPNILKSDKQEPAFYKNLWDTILRGNVWHGELINRRKDGKLYAEEMTVAPVYQDYGEISHFIAIKQDISERKQHELEHEAIIAVANAIRTAITRNEILTVILDQLKELFDADGTMLATKSNTINKDTIIEMGRGAVGERFTGLHIPPDQSISGWVIENRKPYLNNDARTDSRFSRPDLLGDSHAMAAVPLIAQEQVIGALWIARKNEISESDVRLLNAIADLAANAIQRVTLFEQTERQLHRLISLHQIDITISASFDLNVTLNVFLNNVITQLGVDAANILLLASQTQTLEYSAGVGFWTRNIEQSRIRLGDGQAGLAAMQRRIVSLPDLERARENFSRSTLLADERFVSHYVAPLIAKGQIKGILEVFTRKRLDATQEWLDFFETMATQAAIAIDSAALFNNLERSNTNLKLAYDATIEGWSRALDLRDKETEGHTQRVTEMALRLAGKTGMSDMEKLELRRGALLHDIGKMGVPDAILLKPGELTEAEWTIMRQHPTYAYQMLAPISYLRQALDIPYCHHEKWDGSGYPRGLKGEQIPLSARIFAVVDVYDALTSDRPYRKAWPREDAYRYIQEQAGKHFDPQITKKFLETR